MFHAIPHDEKEALEELEPLPARISVLLLREASPGTARVTTNARFRSFWKLVEMELSAIISALRRHLALKEQGADCVVDDRGKKQKWLEVIDLLADRIIKPLLDQYERPHPCHAVLLHRAARCCCRRIAEREDRGDFAYDANFVAMVAQHPLMYKHLLLVGDDTASTSSRTYHHLPYWLKLLLLYMVSMFPQGYKFDKNRLIWKWVIEGLIGEYNWFDSVSKAGEYFSQLVDREVIIQAANYGHKPAAEAEDCRWQVNPDMLQLLASESADKGFACTSGMLNSAAAAGGDSDSSQILHRLSLHQPDPELPTLLATKDLLIAECTSTKLVVQCSKKFVKLFELNLDVEVVSIFTSTRKAPSIRIKCQCINWSKMAFNTTNFLLRNLVKEFCLKFSRTTVCHSHIHHWPPPITT